MRDLPHTAALTACVFQRSIQETLWAGDHTQTQAGVSLCICWWEVWEIFLSKLDTGSQKAKWSSGSFKIDLSPWLCDTRIIMFSHQNLSNCHIWICKLLLTRCISYLGIKDNWGLDGKEFGWTPGVGDGQGGLACCKSWGRKESDMTKRLNWTEDNVRESLAPTFKNVPDFMSLPLEGAWTLCAETSQLEDSLPLVG